LKCVSLCIGLFWHVMWWQSYWTHATNTDMDIVLTMQYTESNIKAQISWNTVCVLYASPMCIPNMKTWSQAHKLHYVSSEIMHGECVPYFISLWGFHIALRLGFEVWLRQLFNSRFCIHKGQVSITSHSTACCKNSF
jgi:hypothetical protein